MNRAESKTRTVSNVSSILTRSNKVQNVTNQIRRLGAWQVSLDRKSLMIHQELLKIPRDVVTLDGRPQD